MKQLSKLFVCSTVFVTFNCYSLDTNINSGSVIKQDPLDVFIENVKRANKDIVFRNELGILTVRGLSVMGASKKDETKGYYGFITSKQGCESFFEALVGENPSNIGYESYFWGANICTYEEIAGSNGLEYYRALYDNIFRVEKFNNSNLDWREIDFSKIHNYDEELIYDERLKPYQKDFFVNEVEIKSRDFSTASDRLTKNLDINFPMFYDKVVAKGGSEPLLIFPKKIRKLKLEFSFDCMGYIGGYNNISYQTEGITVNIDPKDPKNNVCYKSDLYKTSDRIISITLPFGTSSLKFAHSNAYFSKIYYAY